MNGLGAVEAVRGLVEGLLGAGAAPPPAPASPGALAGAAGAALGRAAGELGRGARATWRVAVAGRQAAGAEEVPVSMGLEYLLEVAVLSGAMLVVTRAFQAASPPLAGLLGIKRPLVRKKFAMALREFVFYGISLYLWWACLGHHPWLRDNASLWAPRATGGRVAVVAAEFRFIYTLELCWYTSGLVSLIVDPKKKDFWEMAVHHVATIYLLFFSSLHGHFKIGAVVYFLHNVSDPFLNGAKLLNYLDLDGPCTAAFVGYALVFAGSRLAYYPWVIYNAEFRGPGFHRGEENDFDEMVLIRFLALLFPIHCYWFMLIIKVAYKTLTTGSTGGDNRSDSEDEADDEAKKER